MSDKLKDQQETDKTPMGYTVLVPKRNVFFGNLRKAARPDAPKRTPCAPQNRGKGARRMPTPRGNAPGK